MYEMKGALFGYAARLDRLPGRAVPVPLVSQRHRPSSAALQPHRPARSASPAAPFPDQLVSQPHRFQSGQLSSRTVSGSAGFPAPPFPVRPVGQPHRFRIGWLSDLAGPGRPVARPPRRRAPPAGAKHPRQIPVSRPFPRPGGSPGMVPVSCGESISTPSAPVAQGLAGIHFEFFPRPHVVHRIPPVIRTKQSLSTGFCTTNPQVTWRNSENTSAVAPGNHPLFSGDISLPRSSFASAPARPGTRPSSHPLVPLARPHA